MNVLGIRYCGGCREVYDRVGWLTQLLEELQKKGCNVLPEYDLTQFPEVGLVICGCETQCLAQSSQLPMHWHSVGPNNTFDNDYSSLDVILQVIFDELHCTCKNKHV